MLEIEVYNYKKVKFEKHKLTIVCDNYKVKDNVSLIEKLNRLKSKLVEIEKCLK